MCLDIAERGGKKEKKGEKRGKFPVDFGWLETDAYRVCAFSITCERPRGIVVLEYAAAIEEAEGAEDTTPAAGKHQERCASPVGKFVELYGVGSLRGRQAICRAQRVCRLLLVLHNPNGFQ